MHVIVFRQFRFEHGISNIKLQLSMDENKRRELQVDEALGSVGEFGLAQKLQTALVSFRMPSWKYIRVEIVTQCL